MNCKLCVYDAEELCKQIADLEAKLAESEEQKETLRISQSSTHKTLMQLNDELLKTQKQLAEKDRKIEGLGLYTKNVIDFAIEQLEKVKEKLLEELQNITELLDPLEYEDYHEFIGCGRGYKNSIEEIDNQIKQLNGD